MDPRINSTSPRQPIPSNPNIEVQSATAISSMAPIVLEEDTNICSAAIITLGDDSSEDGSIAAMHTQDHPIPQEEEEDEDEEVTVLQNDPAAGESEQVALPEDDFAGREDESESSGGSYEDEEGLSDGTVLYIGEPEERVMEVDEIHLDIESSVEASEVEESEAQVEMTGTDMIVETHAMIETTTEELLIDLSEVMETSIGSPGYVDEDDETESSLLDSPIMADFASWNTSNDLAPAVPSRAGEYRSKASALTLQQELEGASEDSITLDDDEIANDRQDSDQDSSRSFESDDEDEEMELGNKTLWKELKRSNWVAGDLSTILDPAADEKIPMPADFRGRKRALMQLFLLLSRIVFFIDLGVRRDRIFKLIPERFWLQHFTWTDTRQLFEARDKELCINLLSRTKTVLEEWRLSCRFPRVPETQKDVKEEARGWRKTFRKNRVEALLLLKSHKSDRWLNHIFLDFVDCLPWQDILDVDSDIRKAAVKKVLTMTELCFEQPISVSVSQLPSI